MLFSVTCLLCTTARYSRLHIAKTRKMLYIWRKRTILGKITHARKHILYRTERDEFQWVLNVLFGLKFQRVNRGGAREHGRLERVNQWTQVDDKKLVSLREKRITLRRGLSFPTVILSTRSHPVHSHGQMVPLYGGWPGFYPGTLFGNPPRSFCHKIQWLQWSNALQSCKFRPNRSFVHIGIDPTKADLVLGFAVKSWLKFLLGSISRLYSCN